MNNKKRTPIVDRMTAVFSYFLRLLFPPKCVICKELLLKDGEMCPKCLEIWQKARRSKCPICRKTARACTCRTFHMIDTDTVGERRISSLAFYAKFGSEDERDIATLQLIQGVKTDPDRSAVRLCARELSHEILKSLALGGSSVKDWKITFPPRSKSRVRRFGFDHSQELARMISGYTGIPYEETLINCGSVAQKHLNALERKFNAEGSYKLKKGVTPKGNYIIVDDIITTGATVNTVAVLLKRNGADLVYPVSIARTKNKKRNIRRPAQRPWFKVK